MGAERHINEHQLSNGGLSEDNLSAWFDIDRVETPEMSRFAHANMADAPTLYRGVYRYADQDTTDEKVDRYLRGQGPVSIGNDWMDSETGLPALTSWSEDPRIAHEFAEQGDKGTVYAVSGLRGFPLHKYVDADEHPMAADEKEWMVPASNIRFKHLIKPNKDTQIFVGRSEG